MGSEEVGLEEVAEMVTEEEIQQHETSFLVPDIPARERRISSTTPLFTRPTFPQGAKKIQTQVKLVRMRPRPQHLQLPKEDWTVFSLIVVIIYLHFQFIIGFGTFTRMFLEGDSHYYEEKN